MIRSFRHKGLKLRFEDGSRRGVRVLAVTPRPGPLSEELDAEHVVVGTAGPVDDRTRRTGDGGDRAACPATAVRPPGAPRHRRPPPPARPPA